MTAQEHETAESCSLDATKAGRVSRMGPVVFAFVIWLAMFGTVIRSIEFPMVAGYGPLFFGGATLILTTVVLVREFSALRGARRTRAGDTEAPDEHSAARSAGGEQVPKETAAWVPYVWLLCLVACFVLLGFVLGMATFTLLFLKIYGRESWLLTAGMTVGLTGLVYVLFFEVIGLRPFPGVLFNSLSISPLW